MTVRTFQEILKSWQGRRFNKEAAATLGVPLPTYLAWRHGMREPKELVRQSLEIRMAEAPENK